MNVEIRSDSSRKIINQITVVVEGKDGQRLRRLPLLMKRFAQVAMRMTGTN
jgi:hypothetical protein